MGTGFFLGKAFTFPVNFSQKEVSIGPEATRSGLKEQLGTVRVCLQVIVTLRGNNDLRQCCDY